MTEKEKEIEQLKDKLHNLKAKKNRCAVPEGIQRYTGLIRDVERRLKCLCT